MDRTFVPMWELTRLVIAELDRRLGARGIVGDVFIRCAAAFPDSP